MPWTHFMRQKGVVLCLNANISCYSDIKCTAETEPCAKK